MEIKRYSTQKIEAFAANCFTVWRGPLDGDGLTGEENHDQESLALVDLAPWQLTVVQPGDSGDFVRLDIHVLMSIWKNREMPDEFQRQYSYYRFDGTIFRRNSDGKPCTIVAYWTPGKNPGGWVSDLECPPPRWNLTFCPTDELLPSIVLKR